MTTIPSDVPVAAVRTEQRISAEVPALPRNSPGISPAAPRLDFIDTLRGFACLWVLLHHTFEGKETPPGLSGLPLQSVVGFATIGWLGVSLFLVLSGFCLYYPLVRRNPVAEIRLDLRDFARRRAWRILPTYYIAMALIIGVHVYGGRHGLGHHSAASAETEALYQNTGLLLQHTVAHMLMLQNLRPDWNATISPVFWSLALETQLYVIFPLLIVLARRRGLRAILVVTFVVSLAWQLFVFQRMGFSHTWSTQLDTMYHALPGRCFEFAAGMAAAALVARPARDKERVLRTVALTVLAPALAYVLWLSRYGPLCDQLWGILFAALIVILATGTTERIRSNPLYVGLTWLGTISYSVYLIHMALFNFMSPDRFHINASGVIGYAFLGFGLVRIAIAIGIGYLFFRVAEKPFIDWIAKRRKRAASVALSAGQAVRTL